MFSQLTSSGGDEPKYSGQSFKEFKISDADPGERPSEHVPPVAKMGHAICSESVFLCVGWMDEWLLKICQDCNATNCKNRKIITY